jgi:ABC-2 type transport system permease protein
MFLTYIGSIFSALISIYIFKEYNDNGTELIISSKPLTRIKVVCMKFSACLTLLLTSSILFASISSLLLLTSSASGSQISGFLFSVITSGFALMLIYAMIATLVSFVLGKV